MRIALALLLAILAGAAAGQAAERPAVKAGDEWRFAVYYTEPSAAPSRTWVVKSVGEARIDATENGEPLLLTRDLGVLDSPLNAQSDPRTLSFPLEIGKQWRYSTEWLFKPKGSRGTLDFAVSVVAYEKIRVVAGEFEAFKLVAKGALGGRSPINSSYAGDYVVTYWYAPAARAVVKTVTANPYLGPSTVELVGLRLQP